MAYSFNLWRNMMIDSTFCMGTRCNERESCMRYIKGKDIVKSNTPAWWIQGKEGHEVYRLCEQKIDKEADK